MFRASQHGAVKIKADLDDIESSKMSQQLMSTKKKKNKKIKPLVQPALDFSLESKDV